MHNLDQFIAEWRGSLKSAPNLGPETLDELESHLREIVEKHVRAGVDEPEAFRRAVVQLGSASTVAAEFQKLKTRGWLPVKVAGVILGLAAALASYTVFLLHSGNGGEHRQLLLIHAVVLAVGDMAALLLGIIGICFICQRSRSEFSNRRMERLAPSVRTFARLAASLVAMGIALGMIFSKKYMGAFWSWDLREIGSLSILLWLVGFSVAHRFHTVTPRVLLTSSALSINVVFLGLLMPNLIHFGLRSYRAPVFGWLVIGECVGFFLFLIGLMPAGWLRLRRKEV